MSTAAVISIIDINLLPREQRPAEVSPLAVVAAGLLIAAMIALLPLGFRAQAAGERVDTILGQAKQAESDLSGMQLDLTRQRALRAQLDDAKRQLESAELERSALQGGARPLAADLAALSSPGFLPAGARVKSVAGTSGGLQVEGVALGPLDAIAFADKLATAGGFKSARMGSFTPLAAGGQFSIEVTR
jgi:hypothetical protein